MTTIVEGQRDGDRDADRDGNGGVTVGVGAEQHGHGHDRGQRRDDGVDRGQRCRGQRDADGQRPVHGDAGRRQDRAGRAASMVSYTVSGHGDAGGGLRGLDGQRADHPAGQRRYDRRHGDRGRRIVEGNETVMVTLTGDEQRQA